MENTHRVLTVNIVITLPLEHAYTDSELVDLLKITTEYPEIKVEEVGLSNAD